LCLIVIDGKYKIRPQNTHMTTISTDTLFHFTNRIENIINILSQEFRPNFCMEDLSPIDPPNEFKLAIPLVSFCDIPLSQTTAHMNVYGSYAIGLSESWGKHHALTPVIYAYPGSPITQSIRSIFKALEDFDGSGTTLDDLFRVMCFVKPYEGPFFKNGKNFENVRFYNEREWRFVPDLTGTPYNFGLEEDSYTNISKRYQANSKIQELFRIPFEPPDIKYIIVAHETEILPIIWEIERIKGTKYDSDKVKILSSRIISAEQIETDF
jgi:hypothetical protein